MGTAALIIRTAIGLVAVPALLACARGPTDKPPKPAFVNPVAPPLVVTLSEARAATGKVVRVRGTARHEKLGDSVDTPALNVLCLEPRFPEDLLGKTVTVEGKLELTSDFAATVGPGGEIGQGTEPGTSMYVIRKCMLR